ncbi:hypothetical protein [Streptomyces lomondensis]|uniref:Uncharacterized protein n=1 Tax=Streptomyces lomondensis TaxID=68229 RepID=A0ABQ2X7X4_9ACTN|nr:hypothetical protein [Streptomyces lomondensis]MCF0082430.1 hypothetical protein [Streptomyces lomondensis]GGX04169.1 hypothetical protein GCM10010383_37520 [Streptomyces lomondensis]
MSSPATPREGDTERPAAWLFENVIEAPQHVTPVTVQPREWATGQILYGMNGLTVAPGAELAAIAQPHD